jgi:hypothetical protein
MYGKSEDDLEREEQVGTHRHCTAAELQVGPNWVPNISCHMVYRANTTLSMYCQCCGLPTGLRCSTPYQQPPFMVAVQGRLCDAHGVQPSMTWCAARFLGSLGPQNLTILKTIL